MRLPTTCIGAYPKPDYVPTPDWFRVREEGEGNAVRAYQKYLANLPDDIEEIQDRATREGVAKQVELDIDIPTDGEIRRENYIYYQCRNFEGIDFDNLTSVRLRNGAWESAVPTIRGPIVGAAPKMVRDYQVAQDRLDRPVKISLPGPLTITGSMVDVYYGDEAKLGRDLAKALNQELLALAEAGCTWCQIDEPIFARNPDKALAFGFENLERCFEGLPDTVSRVVHICCGYPNYLDQIDYEKADLHAYFEIAEALEASSVDAVSLEDAHRHNDETLLDFFRETTLIWGAIKIASSKVETVDEIQLRLRQILRRVDAERLIVGPDCGLGFLTTELVESKLANMSQAAHSM